MKFPRLNEAHTHTLHLTDLTKGLNNSEITHDGKDFYLKECKNVWEENGVLKTRPALNTSVSRIIQSDDYADGDFYSYNLENLQFEIDGEAKQIVTEYIDYDISTKFYLVHFINPDGTICKTSRMGFFRITDDIFYIPETINFYKGKPHSGAGLYALVGLVNCENYTQRIGAIYELESNLTVWSSTFVPYIPTLLINGRGNRYEFAKGTNQAFTGTPTRVEGLNILTNFFRACYSTDGYSSTFRLPLSNLSPGEVTGRLYYSVQSCVEWRITANSTSAEATLYGTTVTMNVDREKGIIYFTVPAGEYAVPLVSCRNENNLIITACKASSYSFSDIAFSDAVINADDKILLGNKNTIFEANYNNPHYFPVDSTTIAGNGNSAIMGFAHVGKEIFAFKENEIYSITATTGKKLNNAYLSTDSSAVFYTCDRLTAKRIVTGSGCKKGTKFLNFNDSVYWLATDSDIHCLSNSGMLTRFENQPCLKSLLDINEFSAVAAEVLHDKCLFFNKNKAVVVKLKNQKEPRWFYWEFPQNINILGAYSLKGTISFLCVNTDTNLFYISDLTGEQDCYLTEINNEAVMESSVVSAFAKSSKLSLGCDNSLKKLDYVIINLKGEAKVSINDRLEAAISNLDDNFSKPFKITPALCGVNLFDISFSADTPFTLGSIDIGYTALEL